MSILTNDTAHLIHTWEEERANSNRRELSEQVARVVHTDGTFEPLPGLHLNRASATREHIHGFTHPSFCVIEVRILLPLVTREIILYLLTGHSGDRLRQIALFGGHTDRVARAIGRLSAEYNQPLRVENLAREVGMSASGFHEHFKAVTAMSPLQFQKKLRLQEARRLMLGEDLDASSAAYRVGYDDASNFSREYKRHFGSPPVRDVQRLRARAIIAE